MGSNPSHFKGGDRPVDRVSWIDCVAFCEQLAGRTGARFRLPTEAEWEWACRAGTTTPFHFGETISTDQANYDGEVPYGKGKKGVYRQQTSPVGSFPSNAWGLFDMHGNIREWCSEGFATKEEGSTTNRVLRGGAWSSLPGWRRSARRGRSEPSSRSSGHGCRLVCVD
jgi:formylglycine-generating enzyme required for sulfatase activity